MDYDATRGYRRLLQVLCRLKTDVKSPEKSQWVYQHGLTTLKLLKTLHCYTAKWSDEDKSKHIQKVPINLIDAVTNFAIEFSSYLPEAEMEEAYHDRNLTAEMAMERAVSSSYQDIMYFTSQVAESYEELFTSPQPSSGGDHLSFDEFVTSVQEYLQSLPLDLDSFFKFYSADGKPSEWLPSNSRRVEVYYNNTAEKLGSFKCIICNFAKWCADTEKLKPLLDRARVVVLQIAEYTSAIRSRLNPFQQKFPQEMLKYTSGMSYWFSHNHSDVLKIYQEVIEVIRTEKQEMEVHDIEDLQSFFFSFIISARNLFCILGDLLEFPALDFVVEPNDIWDVVDQFLKSEFAALVGDAEFLNYSSPDTEIRKTNFMSKNLLYQIKLIRAELFLLELHKQKSNLMVVEEDQIPSIRDAKRSLAHFLRTPEEYMDDSEKMMLTAIEAVMRQTRSLCTSYQSEKLTENAILNSSLAMFKLFMAEARIQVLFFRSTSSNFLAKYRLETLHKILVFMRALLSESIDNLVDENCSKFIAAMSSAAAFLVYSFGVDEMKKGQPVDISLQLSQLPKAIDIHTAEFQAIYQKGPWSLLSNSPKCDGVACIDFLLAQMKELLSKKPDTIAYMKEQVEMLLEELEFLRTFLKDVAGHHQNKDLQTRLVCLMYEGEYIVDLFVTGDVPLWYHQLALFIAIEEIKVIKAEVLKFYMENKRCDNPIQAIESASRNEKAKANDPTIEEVIVGRDDQANTIVDRLKHGSRQLQIISIVGMPGIGKTTLAKKIYNNDSIEHHFHVRAWCYVSQVYQKKDLLLDILSDFVELTDKIKNMDDADLALTLYQRLKKIRYLIVLDDMWSIEAWNDLKSSFPDDKNGSQILMTSRLHEVALQVNSEPHFPSLLPDTKCWELLENKIFHQARCPEELVEVGWQIAKNCKGLPLAVVVVAGLLKRVEMTKECWIEVAGQLRTHITDDRESQFMSILEFSYNNLPAYLRPCFLYLGIFLEDQEIPVQKLKRLWISEGLVPKTDLHCVEETAENYLMDLIGRSLVTEARKRSLGGVKTCRVHDMLRDLCLKKAREENFMQLFSTHKGGNSDQSHNPSLFAASTQYRLCFHSTKRYLAQPIPFGPHVHSLVLLSHGSRSTRTATELGYPYNISYICSEFKVLRVLDLESHPVDQSFLSDVGLMFRLTLLAIRGDISSVPSSISNLWSLETLIVKAMRSGDVVLPETIWDMPRLRHIQVNNTDRYSFLSHKFENSVLLDNLETLSTQFLCSETDIRKRLRRLTRLRKFKCILWQHVDYHRNCNVFPAMECLTSLESLKLIYAGIISCPCEFSFPLNLKKLTLSRFRMPWHCMLEIQKLPNLEVLKLLSRAFEGETWDLTEGEFRSLKFLKLEGLDIAVWNASSDHFPKLQHLVLRSCKKLEEVPSSFGESSTLEMIEAH